MAFWQLLEHLVERKDLSHGQATEAMRLLMSGDLHDAEVGAFLACLRIKGCTPVELAAFAGVMRQSAVQLDHQADNLVDTCGTGGGRTSFNLSTAAALVASGAGVKIAKHGNRGVTSPCGSADVLESLGVDLSCGHAKLGQCLNEVGITFLFAPQHHPAMRFVGPSRKVLRFRTVFNQLGPLANPAGAQAQLIGVYDQDMVEPMARALALLGLRRAYVVHGDDGLDEVSPGTGTVVAELSQGEVHLRKWTPADFGLLPLDPAALEPAPTVEGNAAILREAISVTSSPRFAAVLPSASAAIMLAGLAESLPEAVQLAREAVRSGRALSKLERLVQLTSQP